MAGVRFMVDSGDVSFTAATKTILQIIAAANIRLRIERVTWSFKGITAADVPVACELLRQTTAGTVSAATPVKVNESDDETLQVTAGHTATAEPTASTVKTAATVHPQTTFVQTFPPGRELYVKGGERLGARLLSPAQAGTVRVVIEGEE